MSKKFAYRYNLHLLVSTYNGVNLSMVGKYICKTSVTSWKISKRSCLIYCSYLFRFQVSVHLLPFACVHQSLVILFCLCVPIWEVLWPKLKFSYRMVGCACCQLSNATCMQYLPFPKLNKGSPYVTVLEVQRSLAGGYNWWSWPKQPIRVLEEDGRLPPCALVWCSESISSYIFWRHFWSWGKHWWRSAVQLGYASHIITPECAAWSTSTNYWGSKSSYYSWAVHGIWLSYMSPFLVRVQTSLSWGCSIKMCICGIHSEHCKSRSLPS